MQSKQMIRSFCPKFSLNDLMTLKKLYSLSGSLKPKDPRRKLTLMLLTYNDKDKLNNKVTTGARRGCSCDEYKIKMLFALSVFNTARCQHQGFKTVTKLPSIAAQERRSLWGEEDGTFSQTQPVNMCMLYTVCYITFSLHKAAFSSTNKHHRCPYSCSQASCARRVHCV